MPNKFICTFNQKQNLPKLLISLSISQFEVQKLEKQVVFKLLPTYDGIKLTRQVYYLLQKQNVNSNN